MAHSIMHASHQTLPLLPCSSAACVGFYSVCVCVLQDNLSQVVEEEPNAVVMNVTTNCEQHHTTHRSIEEDMCVCLSFLSCVCVKGEVIFIKLKLCFISVSETQTTN